MEKPRVECPDCESPSRRQFLTGAGAAAVVAATGGLSAVARAVAAEDAKAAPAEEAAKRLFASMTAEQKAVAVLPFSDPRATRANANWHIIPQTIEKLYSAEQQQIVREILHGMTSEEGYERLLQQMEYDAGGFAQYSCALFGEPGAGPSACVITGRHLTIRADGDAVPGAVFGGPIVYGHGADGNRKENLFYYQTQAANEVFKALDGKQREKALLPQAPAESSITLKKDQFAGIAAGELSRDQQALVERVMRTLLAPYREADVKEAMAGLKANGGLERVHLSFYKNEDLGNDQEWDLWRLEGPTLVWHFRGAPHVHTWVNFRTAPA